MFKRKIQIFITSLIVLLSPMITNASSLEFRGVKLGMTKQEVKQIVKDTTDLFGTLQTHTEIKNVYLQVSYFFAEEKDSLILILFSFHPNFYEDLKKALIEKYGKPIKTDKELLQNRMGAKFKNESSSWNFKNGDEIYISQYGNSIESGLLTFSGKEYNEEEKRKKAKVKAKPGF